MTRPSCGQVILVLVSLFYISNAAITDKLCDPDWDFANGYCYYFSQAIETLPRSEAIHECLRMDAQLGWPETKTELDFLTSKAISRKAYGWRLNMVSEGGYRLTVYDTSSSKFKSINRYTDNVPKLSPNYDKSEDIQNVCVAFNLLQPDESARKSKYTKSFIWFETVSCSLLLRTACTGAKSDFKDQVIDGNKWFSNDGTIFWVSADLSTFDEAKDLCKSKDMTMVDNPVGLPAALGNWTFDATPFWSSIKLGKDGPQWNNGSAVTAKTFTWNPPSLYYFNYILLSSGKVRSKPFFLYDATKALPYICKKRAISKNQFGCPSLWKRAGQSCYLIGKHILLSWQKAKETCEKQDAHLLTIDSKTELLWLMLFFRDTYLYAWTSANDIASEGNFVWQDGSKMENSIFPWNDGFQHALAAKCTMLAIEDGSFSETICNAKYYAACQYTLEDGENKCADGWKQFKSTCYFLKNDNYLLTTKDKNEWTCMSQTEGVVVHRVKTLEVRSQDVMDFLQGENLKSFFWLGLVAGTVPGQFYWSDNTPYDGDRFKSKKQPDNGSGNGPENCVIINNEGYAEDKSCDKKLWFLCERELRDSASGLKATFMMLLIPLVLGFWKLDCF